VQPGAGASWPGIHVREHGGGERGGAGGSQEHAYGVHRDSDESADDTDRYSRGIGCLQAQESPAGGRQYVYVALLSEPARIGRGHGSAFDNQVFEWAQRRAGRSGRVLDAEQADEFAFVQKAAGAILSPFECWLVLRGVKTLAVRMEKHDHNGQVVADFLAGHRKVKKVFYPGLRDHPQHALAKRQMSGFGSMITFETGSLGNAKKLLKGVRVCSLGESLGGVETLISHPATMTHAALGEKGRAAIGITDGMVRISVGIEDVEDIIADLDQALR